MKNEKVVRGMSTTDLEELECNIREIIRNVYHENNDLRNNLYDSLKRFVKCGLR